MANRFEAADQDLDSFGIDQRVRGAKALPHQRADLRATQETFHNGGVFRRKNRNVVVGNVAR